jgi:hypothetical protein
MSQLQDWLRIARKTVSEDNVFRRKGLQKITS